MILGRARQIWALFVLAVWQESEDTLTRLKFSGI